MRKRKPRFVSVGIDVSKDKLNVAWFSLSDDLALFEVPNDSEGFGEIVRRITAGRIQEARVVIEATGPYSTRLAAHLMVAPRVRVMVVQPRAARDFANANMRRAKTDSVDAAVLADFAKRMDFVAKAPVEKGLSALRTMARHLGELIDKRAAVMNQRHALEVAGELVPVVASLIDREQRYLDELIDELEKAILAQIAGMPEAKQAFTRITAIPGIKDRAAARLLPELLVLPRHLTTRQVTAFAGLDPRPRQSGTSRNGESWPISKQGNSRLRRSLFMATLTAVRWFPPMRALYERLRARGKPKKKAIVAAMRKLLTALWAMIARNEDFSVIKFAGLPKAA